MLSAARLTERGSALVGQRPVTPDSVCGTSAASVTVFWATVHGGLRTIEIAGDIAVMRLDPYGFPIERLIHLDEGAHPDKVEPSQHGHSIGRIDLAPAPGRFVEDVARGDRPVFLAHGRARPL